MTRRFVFVLFALLLTLAGLVSVLAGLSRPAQAATQEGQATTYLPTINYIPSDNIPFTTTWIIEGVDTPKLFYPRGDRYLRLDSNGHPM